MAGFRPKFQSFLLSINFNNVERIETSLHRETLYKIGFTYSVHHSAIYRVH